jgi:hypothetical protein
VFVPPTTAPSTKKRKRQNQEKEEPVLWGNLLFDQRQKEDELVFRRNQEVWVIDSNALEPPAVFHGRTVGKMKDGDWSVELDNESYRTTYPPYCMFSSEQAAISQLRALNNLMNKL